MTDVSARSRLIETGARAIAAKQESADDLLIDIPPLYDRECEAFATAALDAFLASPDLALVRQEGGELES